jgi:hypothetical protein
MSRRTICLISLVPVLALAACGGDDEGTDDFSADVDAVCTESAERINALFTEEGAPTNAEEAAALDAKFVDSRQQEIDELEALEPPEDVAAGYQDFVAARKAVLAGQQNQQVADEQGDQGARELADASIENAFAEADKAAEGIGLEACAGILPAEEEDEVRAVAEQFFEAATAEEFKVPCNEQATDAYIESLGGLKQCLEPGEPRTIEISDVGGVSGVSAEVYFVPTGGPADGQSLLANFVYQDGAWKVDALQQTPPSAKAEAPGDESPRAAYNRALDDLAPAIDVLFIQMDQDSGDLEAVQESARMLRDAFFNFDAELRGISFPAALEESVNSVLEANGTVIADLDAIGEATSAAEATKLVGQANDDFESLYEPASAVLSQGL